MKDQYRAVLVGCSRMGAFIDHEVVGIAEIVLPYSHATVYRACDRTELVACSDLRPDVLAEAGRQHNIPEDRQYDDYKAMIDAEQPDIVSIATQPEPRGEIAVYAAEHGAKAIYAEKAMAASMADADAILEACERNGVFLNLGTQRRWHPGFVNMKEVINDGRIGALRTILFPGSTLFNGASHYYDNVLFLNSDHRALWVQMHLLDGDWTIEGDRLTGDPVGHGVIQFENGVLAYAIAPQHEKAFDARCDNGSVKAWPRQIYEMRCQDPTDSRGKFIEAPFPEWEPVSPNVRLVEDLVHALDTGEPTKGGVRVAHAGTELIFATIESHLRGGARIELPLKGSTIRLQRDEKPKQPKYEPRRL